MAEWQSYFPGQAYRKTCPDQPIHPSVVEQFLVTQAKTLAVGQIDIALAAFAKELPLDAALLPELKAMVAAFSPRALGLRAAYLSSREVPMALDVANEIKTLYGASGMDAELWNAICWNSSLYGQPDAALPFCEMAIQLDPCNPSFLDSRGLERALTGDLAGAAADFKVFVEFTKKAGRYEKAGKLRDRWILSLEKGQNPIDAATIETLKQE
jgi:hypothetical protein